MTTLEEITDFLTKANKLVGKSSKDKYASQYDFILKKGHSYIYRKFTNEENEVLMDALKHVSQFKPKIKECYRNSYLLAGIGSKLGFQYCEGFAAGPIPVNHAWVDYNGLPIDITWRKNDIKSYTAKSLMAIVKNNLVDSSYYGINIPFQYVEKLFLRKKSFMSVIDNWEDGWPLMKKEFQFI